MKTEAPSALPPVKRRNAELVMVALALLSTLGGFGAAGLAIDGALPAGLLGYGLAFAGLAAAAHVALRFIAPYADPLLLPCAVFLTGIGLAMIWRLNAVESAQSHSSPTSQIMWSAIAMGTCIVVLFFFKEPRVLQKYPYLTALGGIILLALPMMPVIGISVYGARRWIGIGPFTMQPSEFAKIAMVVFLAGYLVHKRQIMSAVGKRIKIGSFKILDLPRVRDMGPMIIGWLLAIGLLVGTKDLGTSLLMFGTFLAMIYAATQRSSWIIIGVGLFLVGATVAWAIFWHVQQRVTIWLDAFDVEVYEAVGGSQQLVEGLVGLSYGGLFGTGLGAGQAHTVFAADSDMILISIGEELGLTGLMAVLVVFFLFVERAFRTAVASKEQFIKMFASGLGFVIAFQVFVVLGGVSRLIPMTGMTTPFLSAGGSSLVAAWVIVGLLLRMSHNARRPAPQAIQDEGMTQVISR